MMKLSFFISLAYLLLFVDAAQALPSPGVRYQIVPMHSEKCLHVKSASTENRAPIWQWECQDDPEHFQFFFDRVDREGEYYYIRSAHSG